MLGHWTRSARCAAAQRRAAAPLGKLCRGEARWARSEFVITLHLLTMSVAAFCRLVAQGTPVLLQSGLQRAAASALSRVAPISQQRQIDIWWPGSGFASAAGGDGSGGGSGSGASAGSTASGGQRLGEDEKGRQQPQPPQQQQQQGNQPQQQQQSSAQARLEEKGQSEASQPGPAQGEQAAAAAANSGGAGSTGGETQGLETGDIHPELKKYIDQLKQLKGENWLWASRPRSPPRAQPWAFLTVWHVRLPCST